MARPTDYCQKCGEYVLYIDEYVPRRGQLTRSWRWVHIDADGNVIHRAHAPVPEARA